MKSTLSSNVTLGELSKGAVEELYQQGLALVLANIDDPNTPAGGKGSKRELSIKLVFNPKQDRQGTDVDISVSTKLCAPKPIETFFSLKKAGNDLMAFEPTQADMTFTSNTN